MLCVATSGALYLSMQMHSGDLFCSLDAFNGHSARNMTRDCLIDHRFLEYLNGKNSSSSSAARCQSD